LATINHGSVLGEPPLPNTKLTDYLYRDKRRIEGFFEQVSDPVKYDKVPVWKAALSLTGPTAEATQSRTQRAFTDHEKVLALVEYLSKENLIDFDGRTNRSRGRDPNMFRIEMMSARRTEIKPGTLSADTTRTINLWVSPNPQNRDPGALFLIEDYTGPDDSWGRTSYTALSFLMDTIKETPEDIFSDGHTDKNLWQDSHREFAADPLGVLGKLGATFGPERRITALYRLRAECQIGRDPESPEFRIMTVGYPLVITTEGGVLDVQTGRF
jgi:hypothetical protein